MTESKSSYRFTLVRAGPGDPRLFTKYNVHLQEPEPVLIGAVEQRSTRSKTRPNPVFRWFARQTDGTLVTTSDNQPREFKTRRAAATTLRDLRDTPSEIPS